MIAWPATLPQRAERPGYQSGTGDGRARSGTDSGIAKVRRRFSAIPRPLQLQMKMTRDQLDIFKAFIATDLVEGTKPFTFPNQEGSGTWIVQFGRDMPTWIASTNKWLVSFDLVILP